MANKFVRCEECKAWQLIQGAPVQEPYEDYRFCILYPRSMTLGNPHVDNPVQSPTTVVVGGFSFIYPPHHKDDGCFQGLKKP